MVNRNLFLMVVKTQDYYGKRKRADSSHIFWKTSKLEITGSSLLFHKQQNYTLGQNETFTGHRLHVPKCFLFMTENIVGKKEKMLVTKGLFYRVIKSWCCVGKVNPFPNDKF